MAETPKGDTTSSTDAPDTIRASAGRADPIAADVTSKTRADSVDGGTIAGDAGADSLASVEAASDTTDRVTGPAAKPAADDRPATVTAPARGGGLRRTLILVILVALVAGGGYASYPMWRAEVEPLARQLGIALPPVRTATAPETAKTPEPAKVPAPKPSAPASGTGSQTAAAPAPVPAPAPTPASAPTPPVTVSDPALAGDIDRLADRMSALEERLATLESRPVPEPEAPEPPKADAAALDKLAARVDEMAQTLSAATDEVAIVREGLASSGGGEGLGPMAEKLSERLQGLTDRIEALENAPAKPAVAPERLDGLQAGLDAAQARLDEAQAQSGTLQAGVDGLKVQSGELRAGLDRQQARLDEIAGSVETAAKAGTEARAALESRLVELQTRIDGLAGALDSTRSGRERAGAFLLASNQLAAVAATSGGFEPELAALTAAAPADEAVGQALETLRGHAGGVPSLAVLRDRFAATASRAVDASVVGSDEGVVGQTLTRIAALVTIRRTVTDDGNSLEALLLRAEAALNAGDLPAAVTAVKKLDGDPAKAVAGWLGDAEARAAVDGAVRTLQSKALTGVAGG